jgi:hypothetical protein
MELRANVVPSKPRTGGGVVEAPIELGLVPARDRYLFRRNRQTVPDVFEELEAVGGWQPQNLILERLRSHKCNLVKTVARAQAILLLGRAPFPGTGWRGVENRTQGAIHRAGVLDR